MFLLIPAIISFGILYLLGEWLFRGVWHRWIFIVFAFFGTWIFSGFAFWYELWREHFMPITDVLGNPINWIDADWKKLSVWIVTIVGVGFVGSIFITYLIILPFSRKHWWQFWKK